MKLDIKRPNIETSADLEEKLFSIGDHGLIFDVLRSKMYSNPIVSICREYASNARDAMIEAGRPDVPITIHLPSNLEPYYKVKDTGVGISPNRIENVFIRYGASTKREDNKQLGGFGLGCKVAFSAVDSFTVITNYNGVQYNYACFIDETKVGKLAVLSENPTDQPNGTEIIVPVKPQDFAAFNTATEQACRHWKPRPNITGGSIAWKELKPILTGNKWFIATNTQYDYERSVKLIIDGIEYPLDMNALRSYAKNNLFDSVRGNLYLTFGIGELSLSANREQVYLDKPTQKTISDRLDAVLNEVKQLVNDKIVSFDNLFDANVYYRKDLATAFQSLGFLGKMAWQGIELSCGSTYTDCTITVFSKGGEYFSKSKDTLNKVYKRNSNHLNFTEHSALYINDLPLKEVMPKHVKLAFEGDPNLTSVQVICPNDKITVDKLNETIHLDKMAPKLLSSIAKASVRKYTAASTRVLVFAYDNVSGSFRQTSYATTEEDTNTKVLCKLIKAPYPPSNRHAVLANGMSLSANMLRALLKHFPNTTFYGVDKETDEKRIKEDFGDFVDVEKYITKLFAKSKIDFVGVKAVIDAMTQSYNYSRSWDRHDKLPELITNPKSTFKQSADAFKMAKEMQAHNELLTMYETFKGALDKKDVAKWIKDHPEYDVVKLSKAVEKKYVLLRYIETYYAAEVVEQVADYINMIDAKGI